MNSMISIQRSYMLCLFCRRRPFEIPIQDDSGNHNDHPSRSYPPLHSCYPAGAREPQPHTSNHDDTEVLTVGNRTDDTEHWLAASTDSSLDETDIDMLPDADRDKDIYR